jgi:diguanylate cyclase (GGDEF)-like protein/PAS domain S-box-containing protein
MKTDITKDTNIKKNNNDATQKYDAGFVPSFRHKPTDIASDALILDTLMNNSQNTIYFKNRDSKFILIDTSHAKQFGVRTPADLIGKSDFDIFPESLAKQKRQDEVLIMKTGIPIINKMEQGLNSHGDILVLSTSKYPLYDYEGNIIGTWGTSRDITKLVKAEEELARANTKLQALSLVDDLTGLSNQRHFYDTLDLTVKQYTRKRLSGFSADFCLIFLDIDNFKQINDTYGHLNGDAALRFLAGHLLANTRSKDSAFRYGGDEFAIILPNIDLIEGKKVAEKIRHIIEITPLTNNKCSIHLHVSLGVVVFDNETDSSTIVEKADTQLYQAKKEGKNLVR